MAAIGAECARFWYNMLHKMNVRTRQNQLGCGVRQGRDGEEALNFCSRGRPHRTPQISRYLDLEGKNKSANQTCQFWYEVCTTRKWFNAFETVAENYLREHNRPLPDDGAAATFFKISTSVFATAQKGCCCRNN